VPFLRAAEGRTDVTVEAATQHINQECGDMAAVVSHMPRTIPSDNRILTAERVKGYLRERDQQYARTTPSCAENTYNWAGGRDVAAMNGLRALCHDRGLHLHVDRARVFNAVVAPDVSAADLPSPTDSVPVNLGDRSSAPVGGPLQPLKDHHVTNQNEPEAGGRRHG